MIGVTTNVIPSKANMKNSKWYFDAGSGVIETPLKSKSYGRSCID